MSSLSVALQSASSSGGWDVRWQVDGQDIGPTIAISPALIRELGQLSPAYEPAPDPTNSRSARRGRPFLPVDAVGAIGQQFLQAVCGEIWSEIHPRLAAGPTDLLIRTDIPAALNLPWELLPFGSGGKPVGTDPAWGVYRVPVATAGTTAPAQPGPLRMLFLAASAEGSTILDYEREEEAILRAVGGVRDVILFIAEMGTVEELAERVEKFRPHVVHLSGHGMMRDDGTAVFCFEDERGRPDLQPAAELVRVAFARHRVRMVFFNGCETGAAAVAGLCQAFVGAGVPLALGWSASVADDRATDFSETLYSHLALGNAAAEAVAHARARIERDGFIPNATIDGRPAQDMTFALPHLYATRPGAALYDRTRVEEYKGDKTEYVLLPNGVEGLREGFIGRRRDQQALIPPLRDGDFTVVVLHGIGGQGKSTLATRIANRLGANFRTLAVKPVRRAGESAIECARRTVDDLLDEFRTAFMDADRPDVYKRLTNPNYAPADKLRSAVDAMNEVPFLLVLDNWEDVLDLATGAVADDALATFYRRLMTHLTRTSRAIVTTRILPDTTPTNARLVRVLGSLKDFKDYEFRKFLRRDPAVAKRMHPGDLSDDLVQKLHAAIGGTPRFLGLLRTLLRTHDAGDLEAELEEGSGLVARQRDAYLEGIFGEKLFASLTDDGRLVVTRLAVSILPVPADGVAAATGLPLDRATAAARNAARYGLLQEFVEAERPTLYLPPGLLAGWLARPDRLPIEAASAAHLALAGFWKDVYEKDRGAEVRTGFLDGFDACCRHARYGGNPVLALWAGNIMAETLHRFAEWARARRVLEDVIPGATEEEGELGRAWYGLASIDLDEGKYEDARKKFAKSLAIQERNKATFREAAVWHQLALIDYYEGKYSDARDKLAKSETIMQSIGDTSGEANFWHSLACIDLEEGKYEDARDKYEKSLDLKQRTGDISGEAATWLQLSQIDLHEEKYEEARDKCEKSLELKQQSGATAGEAYGWHQLASIDFAEGKYDDARDKFARAITIRQRVGDTPGVAITWVQLGNIDIEEGKLNDARDKLTKSLAILQMIGQKAMEATVWQRLGILASVMDRGQEGVPMIALCYLLDQSIGHGDTESDLQVLCHYCSELSYTQEQFVEMLQTTAESYQRDRGQILLRAAFPDTST